MLRNADRKNKHKYVNIHLGKDESLPTPWNHPLMESSYHQVVFLRDITISKNHIIGFQKAGTESPLISRI